MTCHVNTTDRWNIVAIMPLNLMSVPTTYINTPSRISIAWFPYGYNARKNRVTIILNSQFIIVYTCKPHINHKYSLVTITQRIFSVPHVAHADEKDRDSIFTTLTTIWKPGLWFVFRTVSDLVLLSCRLESGSNKENYLVYVTIKNCCIFRQVELTVSISIMLTKFKSTFW